MKPIMNATSGSSNLAVVLTLGMSSEYQWELDEFKLHLSGAATAANTLTIQQKSKNGSAYDTVLLAQPMSGVADLLWQPDRPVKLNGRDYISVTWTNDAASFKTWGTQINYRA